MELCNLIYLSKAREAVSPAHLEDILQVARHRNADAGVTGMLVYKDSFFLQALEGSHDSLQRIFGAISLDQRHTGIKVLATGPIERRSFSQWSMGFKTFVDGELMTSPGAENIFQTEGSLRVFARMPEQAYEWLTGVDQAA